MTLEAEVVDLNLLDGDPGLAVDERLLAEDLGFANVDGKGESARREPGRGLSDIDRGHHEA